MADSSGDERNTTSLSLPSSLPYPITITRVLVSQGDEIDRGTTLLQYTFTSATATKALAQLAAGAIKEVEEDIRENDLVGSWESTVGGKVEIWHNWVQKGAVVDTRQAGKPALDVLQPCDHPVQYFGMCTICGETVNSGNDDYLSRQDESDSAGPSRKRGEYQVSHDTAGLVINEREARNQAKAEKESLLGERKLILVVDLDQTIIHSTVDPTVGEWMAEVEADNKAARKSAPDSTTPPGSPKEGASGKNPNAKALADVARFQLDDDLPPGGARNNKGKPLQSQHWYYTKPRPGLHQFLTDMSAKYEMYVYTMGTRSYADNICHIIDPTEVFFKNRILTRDESGSFTKKDLTRLFPTDYYMVAIIDDRSDVWVQKSHLVKVNPYDFFVGIGDINSSFLPPVPTLAPSPSSSAATPESVLPTTPSSANEDADASLVERAKLLDAVSEDRPLAKLQEEKDEQAAAELEKKPAPVDQLQSAPAKPRAPLLNNHDVELDRIQMILDKVHEQFYAEYELWRQDPRVAFSDACDVGTLIEEQKSQILRGCKIVFSGIIPMNVRPEATVYYTHTEDFGGHPTNELTSDVTHCVITKMGTMKMYKAFTMGIKVVWLDWWIHSVAQWKRLDEAKYLVPPPSPPTPRPRRSPAPPEAGPSSGSQAQAVPAPAQTDTGAGPVGDGADVENDFEVQADEWDGLDAEFADWQDDGNDYDTDGESVRSRAASPSSSMPGTPRKRVRYADEESLPLESFREPVPPDGSESPPRKRPKPLLLEAPNDGDVPDVNKFQWQGKMRQDSESDPPTTAESANDGQSEAGADDDDDFAKMLMENLEDEQ